MATRTELRQLRAVLLMDAADRQALAEEFVEWKIRTYIDTLADLAEQHGYSIENDEIVLADDVIAALAQEARTNAGRVVATFNEAVEGFLERNAHREPLQIVEDYAAWADDRGDRRAEMVAVTEAYSAHVDALASFYDAAGVEPWFDFGGHGDDAPRCEVCQALAETGPHPLSRVREIGIPHINCRQEWHRVDDPDLQLPDELVIGARTGGIVGTEPLVNRNANDHEAAAAEIRRLAAPQEE